MDTRFWVALVCSILSRGFEGLGSGLDKSLASFWKGTSIFFILENANRNLNRKSFWKQRGEKKRTLYRLRKSFYRWRRIVTAASCLHRLNMWEDYYSHKRRLIVTLCLKAKDFDKTFVTIIKGYEITIKLSWRGEWCSSNLNECLRDVGTEW